MTAPRTLIHSVRAISDGVVTEDAWLLFDDGRIRERGTGTGWTTATDRGSSPAEIVDAEGMTLTPGFVDLHCHGGAGIDVSAPGADLRAALAPHRAAGTTRSVVSLATAPVEDLLARLRELRHAVAADPLVLGVHLEGPFLSAERSGAHAATLLRDPEPALVEALLTAGGDALLQVTVAPELPGALDAIRLLHGRGVVAAVGHTAATGERTAAAIAAGARLVTHALNAMAPIAAREPGPVGAALADDRVVLELIGDGTHLHDDTARLLIAAGRGRIAFVSDALAATGAEDGGYRLAGVPYRVERGVARLADGTLAGATDTLDVALRRAVSELGMSLVDAVDALTVVPARVLGVDGSVGALTPGLAADAVLLNAELGVRGVWADGTRLR
ncbi:N-acetylglucosamine-6-phosphate deacetylase [Mycetocola reblochoni]|uniref:N-acetylglucosamine-6-phosphate deacetylase n=2 Tax=Mycetocola reblochoni TaxID=331618 RepID=A0A1R4KCV6_9MICO|nr:amidohydrolase family protein [Mycetocola reblochoni]RLP69271.1 N-acetylglucosamine-6-phosphate deacetylase [Mycetocola reblochoni]SJN42005.1 N-acetylglucosamine-6-phosphate deacetylase [Mycetocola reblochoni REB411]